MIQRILRKIVGTKNEREMKKMRPMVARISELEPRMEALSDAQLQALTPAFRQRLANGEPLDDLLPEAFAAVREAGRRTLGLRHYDVQMVGGMVLHSGRIAEMKTGEGKTLVATLPMYLNALEGKGAHLITVNDYLAARDAEWMGQIYNFLGMSVGVIVSDMDDADRQAAYRADITYGQNNEFGFDYLRDNMKFDLAHYVQRDLHYAIVDEVDSILIDEARTPLIISGPAEESTDLYYKVNAILPFLKREQDFLVDEKSRSVSLTESGVDKVERRLSISNLYDADNVEILHHVYQALKAHTLFKRDVNYLVEEGKVIIVDEFTGRKMQGRRWSDGLHQAVEAKEGLQIQQENQTLATITFQNYFRMYKKLSGMTGTADTEAEEFAKIYKLDVLVIPTNRSLVRRDDNDLVYKTQREKTAAIIEEIMDCHERGQPVLVGTVSVEKSEFIANILRKNGVKHHVLNAKQHGREAEVIAQAGRKGAVTISTNMAGRGTDIILGGNAAMLAKGRAEGATEGEAYERAIEHFKALCMQERAEVLAAGGLHIVGTERHESRRVDNQLRGRAGRQGDPGSSRFFLSLDDDLLRIFGAERIAGIMDRLKMPEGEPIEHRWISKAIENAQKKVEGHNFDIRKNLLEYDDVMNQQRKTIYGLRRKVLEGKETHELVLAAIEDAALGLCDQFMPEGTHSEEWDLEGLTAGVVQTFRIEDPDMVVDAGGQARNYEAISRHLVEVLQTRYEERCERIIRSLAARARETAAADDTTTDEERLKRARDSWLAYERRTYLGTIDQLWKGHLLNMDHLREGVHLEAYAQKDPKLAYKREGFKLFEQMVQVIREDVSKTLFRVEVSDESAIQRTRQRRAQPMYYGRGSSPGQAPTRPKTFRREQPKVGRNELCPCGSGKKYKRCCMAKDQATAAHG
jgi:preprotein translocase subunit SecA